MVEEEKKTRNMNSLRALNPYNRARLVASHVSRSRIYKMRNDGEAKRGVLVYRVTLRTLC